MDPKTEALVEALSAASHGPYHTPTLYQALKEAGHPVERLLDAAAEVNPERPYVAEIAVVVAIEAACAAGEAPPERAAELLTLRSWTEQGASGFTFLDELRAAVEALSPAQRRAVLGRILDERYSWTAALPLVSAQPDEDLVDRALERVAGDPSANVPAFARHARALATWGGGWLERFAAEADALAGDPARQGPYDAFVQAVIHLLAARAAAGEPLPEVCDRFLRFRGVDQEEGLEDYYFLHNVLPALRTVLRALPTDRAAAVIRAGLDPSYPYFARAFRALPDVDDPELCAWAFRQVAEHAEALRMPDRDWLRFAVSELGEAAVPLVAEALSVSDEPQLQESFSKGLGDTLWEQALARMDEPVAEATPADVIRRLSERWLAEHAEARTTPIYLLTRLDALPVEGAVSRVGGLPWGVTDETWPLRSDVEGDAGEGARRQHLFTLDLREMPELSAKLGGAAGLAFFIDDASNNRAWSPGNGECAQVPLSEEDLARGPYTGDVEARGRARGVRIERVVVPSAAFSTQEGELGELRTKIFQAHGRALGDPLWVQGDDHWGLLLMQFDEGFVDINLGDCGVMYVFSDTAFWQCY